MRFTVTGEWTRNRLLALIVWFFLLFSLGLWATNLGLYLHSMGTDIAGIQAHYLGDEATFRSPRSIRGLLEVTHFHLFAMGLFLLTWTHLLLFVPISLRARAFWITTAFVSALADEASGWLIRFVHRDFAYLKMASFCALQVSLLVIFGLVSWALASHAKSAYRDGERSPKEAKAPPDDPKAEAEEA